MRQGHRRLPDECACALSIEAFFVFSSYRLRRRCGFWLEPSRAENTERLGRLLQRRSRARSAGRARPRLEFLSPLTRLAFFLLFFLSRAVERVRRYPTNTKRGENSVSLSLALSLSSPRLLPPFRTKGANESNHFVEKRTIEKFVCCHTRKGETKQRKERKNLDLLSYFSFFYRGRHALACAASALAAAAPPSSSSVAAAASESPPCCFLLSAKG